MAAHQLKLIDIKKVDFVNGAKSAEGITVIIDVFRAFSVACYCFDRGVSTMVPVGEVDIARDVAKTLDNSVLIGERKGKKIPGFDFGNSPSEILSADLSGKVVVHTTHAGTQGIVNATNADEILTGAFVNAKATCKYIKSKNPKKVTLVRMGLEATTASDEDNLCADYMENLLCDQPFDSGLVVGILRESPFSKRFFDPEKPWSPSSDFDLCLDVDRFSFVIRADKDSTGLIHLRRH